MTRRRWRLTRPPAVAVAPVQLDPAQQRVVERVATPGHGPLLVLAGPGTGKTTTVVEAVAARAAGGTDPGRILTLTFSRKAAQDLRARIGARLGRTAGEPVAWTFHGFGYALLGRTVPAEEAYRTLRLLTGAEQEALIRELLTHDVETRQVAWPPSLQPALGTRGFSEEVQALLGRVRALGLETPDLAALAAAAATDPVAPPGPRSPDELAADWVASASFLDEYLDVLGHLGALDYPELVARAAAYAASPHGRAELRGRYDLVVVDEYQDTDPAQERLLQELAGDGRDLVVVGDPDQSIYAFRGAEVRGIADFRDRFRRADGGLADVMTLSVSRRSGAALLAATRSVAARLPLAGSAVADALRRHRDLGPVAGAEPGSVEVATFPTRGHELGHVADLLRREHLEAGTPWSQMAVLVRSGGALAVLRRTLGSAGVPVQVAGDEVPLVDEPAVAPLLLALRVVAEPGLLTPDAARTLLLSPLGGADPAALRRLGRALREQARLALDDDGVLRASAELVCDAVADPRQLVGVRPEVAAPAHRLSALLAAATEVERDGGSVYDVLWALWSGTSWPRRLEEASYAGGPGGRTADRDLDAVVALFDTAARDEERTPGRGLAAFLGELEMQQVPGDPLAERGVRPEAVRLLTAHRSKGLEWEVVVVSGVQADEWPDLRRRGSLLEPDRLGADGVLPPTPTSALLDEERRLFYVAATRARRRLVVTAVDSADVDGTRPSRFLDELGVAATATAAAPPRPMTLPGLVAELRAVSVAPDADPRLREAAAARLAVLAAETEAGATLAPSAHPDRWWGLRALSEAPGAMHPRGTSLRLSASSLQTLAECPLRWFLGHEARAESARDGAASFGSVVHVVADQVAREALPADVEAAMTLVDAVWPELDFQARWDSARQRRLARESVERFLLWHALDRGRTLVASEARFSVPLEVGDRTVVLRGSLDRVELDTDGHVVVVDLKTQKNPPAKREVEQHVQLAVYQHAVRVGALDALVAAAGATPTHEPGGAELVQLRHSAGAKTPGPKTQWQPPLRPDEEGLDAVDGLLASAVALVDAERFPARPGDWCRMCPYRGVCPTTDQGRQVVE